MTDEQSWPRVTFVMSKLRQTVPARWRISILLLMLGALTVRVTMLDDTWIRLLLVGGDRMGLVAKEHDARLKAHSTESLQSAIEASKPSTREVKP